ncbi:NAD(P)/FAD-dependent oxidoreductase [Myceligenerans salitolerans]|uniref:FAD-dependent oxidoreductase n=1 Tax=Myceligenerans salitolerans TaxID=1230528 RepID=A0ABS3IAX9_9MICO|nr:FAD-dependent oxidoreductase [Myceligenerans salitolerans]MBO0609212.1 FAD-dependent oxidoreductase [Myceligenerans salitolerans]
MGTRTEVVVIGAGYAGVLAANRLTRRDDVAVTLINPRAEFVERIRLHQLVAGNHDAVVDLADVLAPRVRLVVDAVDRIDVAGRALDLASGGRIGYDRLVYAVGSRAAAPEIPGAAEHAHPIATVEDARRLRSLLHGAAPGAPVVVVGAGPTGIETAAELGEQGHAVTLVCGDTVGPYLHPRVRDVVTDRLDGFGVTVLQGPGATVREVAAGAVRLADGRDLRSGLTIWTAGFGVPDLARRSGLTTDEVGRLITDETLTSVDDDRIVAAGDSAAPSGTPFRMSCQAALPLGAIAADTVLARLAGRPPRPANVVFAGQCLSLGRTAGLFQLASLDDRAGRRFLGGGRAGAWLKELVCTSTVKELRHEARRPGQSTLHRLVRKDVRSRYLRRRTEARVTS